MPKGPKGERRPANVIGRWDDVSIIQTETLRTRLT